MSYLSLLTHSINHLPAVRVLHRIEHHFHLFIHVFVNLPEAHSVYTTSGPDGRIAVEFVAGVVAKHQEQLTARRTFVFAGLYNNAGNGFADDLVGVVFHVFVSIADTHTR